MIRYFVDTSVFLMAAGGEHPDRAACRGFLASAAQQRSAVHVSVEAVQEFLFHRMRREQRDLALRRTQSMRSGCETHPFDDVVLHESLRLVETTALRGRDAVHAATALLAGFSSIVSLDSDLDEVPGLARVHPSAAAG